METNENSLLAQRTISSAIRERCTPVMAPAARNSRTKSRSLTASMLFSATLDAGVDKLVKRFLNRPLEHSVDTASSPVVAMTHHALLVADPGQKRQVVRELASGAGRRLLFTRTKHQARKLARELTSDGIPAVELHGNLSQNARERGLKAFADGRVRVMAGSSWRSDPDAELLGLAKICFPYSSCC